MIEGKTVLAVIPARGGSKRFPGKNIALLREKPLIAWTIEAARASRFVDRVVVSSDSDEVNAVAREFGADVPFVRPADLAEDDTTMWQTLAHVLEEIPGFDFVVLLQPTSPLRTSSDIDAAIQLSFDRRSPVVGVCAAPKPPEWLYYLDDTGRMEPVLGVRHVVARRQDARAAFALNGAVYVATVGWLLDNEGFLGPETLAFEMPARHSIDIDSPLDLEIAAAILGADS